jgi:metal-sulfur cluster biosynthetic enzyme
MLTEDDIREALRACFDPTHKRNIVDLGLIRSIALTLDPEAPGAGIPGVPPRQSLTLQLTAPSSDEDANTILLAQIENRIAGVPNLSRWRITFVPPAFPILNNR